MYAAASLPRPAVGPGERVRVRARTLSRAQNRTLRVRRVGGYQGSTVVTGVQGQKNKGTRTCAVRALVSLCPPRPLLRFPSALLPQAIRQNEGTWPVSCTPEMAGGGAFPLVPGVGVTGLPPSSLRGPPGLGGNWTRTPLLCCHCRGPQCHLGHMHVVPAFLSLGALSHRFQLSQLRPQVSAGS